MGLEFKVYNLITYYFKNDVSIVYKYKNGKSRNFRVKYFVQIFSEFFFKVTRSKFVSIV